MSEPKECGVEGKCKIQPYVRKIGAKKVPFLFFFKTTVFDRVEMTHLCVKCGQEYEPVYKRKRVNPLEAVTQPASS